MPVGDAVAGNATDGYVGFFEGGTYYYDREGKNVAISFGNGSPATADITASLAELYFSGMPLRRQRHAHQGGGGRVLRQGVQDHRRGRVQH